MCDKKIQWSTNGELQVWSTSQSIWRQNGERLFRGIAPRRLLSPTFPSTFENTSKFGHFGSKHKFRERLYHSTEQHLLLLYAYHMSNMWLDK